MRRFLLIITILILLVCTGCSDVYKAEAKTLEKITDWALEDTEKNYKKIVKYIDSENSTIQIAAIEAVCTMECIDSKVLHDVLYRHVYEDDYNVGIAAIDGIETTMDSNEAKVFRRAMQGIITGTSNIPSDSFSDEEKEWLKNDLHIEVKTVAFEKLESLDKKDFIEFCFRTLSTENTPIRDMALRYILEDDSVSNKDDVIAGALSSSEIEVGRKTLQELIIGTASISGTSLAHEKVKMNALDKLKLIDKTEFYDFCFSMLDSEDEQTRKMAISYTTEDVGNSSSIDDAIIHVLDRFEFLKQEQALKSLKELVQIACPRNQFEFVEKLINLDFDSEYNVDVVLEILNDTNDDVVFHVGRIADADFYLDLIPKVLDDLNSSEVNTVLDMFCSHCYTSWTQISDNDEQNKFRIFFSEQLHIDKPDISPDIQELIANIMYYRETEEIKNEALIKARAGEDFQGFLLDSLTTGGNGRRGHLFSTSKYFIELYADDDRDYITCLTDYGDKLFSEGDEDAAMVIYECLENYRYSYPDMGYTSDFRMSLIDVSISEILDPKYKKVIWYGEYDYDDATEHHEEHGNETDLSYYFTQIGDPPINQRSFLPEQIRYVVLHEYVFSYYSTYYFSNDARTSKGYRVNIKISLIDKLTGKIIKTKTLLGDSLPFSISVYSYQIGRNYYGNPPDDKIVDETIEEFYAFVL